MLTFPTHDHRAYRKTIPWIWLTTALISWRHPGDEYELFGVANGLPSAWVSLWFKGTGSPNDIIPTLVLCSLGSMLLISWGMDWLRVPSRLVMLLWAVAGVVLFWMLYGSYESHARAIAKNGSLTAYVSASSNLGLFLACVVAIVLTAGYHMVRRFVPVRSASEGGTVLVHPN